MDHSELRSETLQRIFERERVIREHLRNQLSYDEMRTLAVLYEGWAQQDRFAPEIAAKMLGWADGLKQLAWIVGEDWKPPENTRKGALSVIGSYLLEDSRP